MLMEKVKNSGDKKPLIRLCRVDPTDNPLYRTSLDASQAVATAVHSYNYNSYSPTVGLPDAKRFLHFQLLSILIQTTLSCNTKHF